MEWWGWITWSVTALIALGGLVLGIRAERRVSVYKADWSVFVRSNVTIINRTGEDASDVFLSAQTAEKPTTVGFVRNDEERTVMIRVPMDTPFKSQPFVPAIYWTRSRTGERYVWQYDKRKGHRVASLSKKQRDLLQHKHLA
ncbi:MAG: hypothetical protein WBA28_05475 [Microbacteriaceae bacterium]